MPWIRASAASACVVAFMASVVVAQTRPGGNGPLPGDPGYGENSQPQYQAPARPTGHWVTTWGAISADGEKGIVGSVTGVSSEGEAKRQALAQCTGKGGNCTQTLAYYNQCAVLSSGAKSWIIQGAATIEEASRLAAQNLCDRGGDTNCRVVFSECTKPYFVPD